jgi:hypothetical protein
MRQVSVVAWLLLATPSVAVLDGKSANEYCEPSTARVGWCYIFPDDKAQGYRKRFSRPIVSADSRTYKQSLSLSWLGNRLDGITYTLARDPAFATQYSADVLERESPVPQRTMICGRTAWRWDKTKRGISSKYVVLLAPDKIWMVEYINGFWQHDWSNEFCDRAEKTLDSPPPNDLEDCGSRARRFPRQGMSIKVVSRRPMADGLLQFGRDYGWAISYEDPEYSYAGDVEDVTHRFPKEHAARLPRKPVLVPSTHSFSFSVPSSREGLDECAVLRLMTAAYAAERGIKFELRQAGTHISVAAVSHRDKSGEILPYTPLLDTPISITREERTAIGALLALTQTLSAATGKRVVAGTVPTNLLSQWKGIVAAENERARDVLAKLIDSVQSGRASAIDAGELAWHVYCDPGLRQCALNLQTVRTMHRDRY